MPRRPASRPAASSARKCGLCSLWTITSTLASHSSRCVVIEWTTRRRNVTTGSPASSPVASSLPSGPARLAIAFRNYGMHTLRFHPRKEQAIERVLAPLREAAEAITI